MDMKRVPSIVFHQRLTVRLPTAPAQKSAETFASAAERNFTYYSITDVNVPELLAMRFRQAFRRWWPPLNVAKRPPHLVR